MYPHLFHQIGARSLIPGAASTTLERNQGEAERLDAPDVGDIVLAADREIVTEPFHRLPALGRFVLERNATAVGAGIVLTEPPPL